MYCLQDLLNLHVSRPQKIVIVLSSPPLVAIKAPVPPPPHTHKQTAFVYLSGIEPWVVPLDQEDNLQGQGSRLWERAGVETKPSQRPAARCI